MTTEQEAMMISLLKYKPCRRGDESKYATAMAMSLAFDLLGYAHTSELNIAYIPESAPEEANARPHKNELCIKQSMLTNKKKYAINIETIMHECYHIYDMYDDIANVRNGARCSRLVLSDFHKFFAKVITGEGIYNGLIVGGEAECVADIQDIIQGYTSSEYVMCKQEVDAREFSNSVLNQMVECAKNAKSLNRRARKNAKQIEEFIKNNPYNNPKLKDNANGIMYEYGGMIEDIVDRVVQFMTAEDEMGDNIMDKVSTMEIEDYVEFKKNNGNIFGDMLTCLYLQDNKDLADKMRGAIVKSNKVQMFDNAKYLEDVSFMYEEMTSEEKNMIQEVQKSWDMLTSSGLEH
ncbi:MAG: hypothetical protein E7361_00190 [Clostridiales bacterium]|nr:hypothetical protein [Clostridiales bacterium]